MKGLPASCQSMQHLCQDEEGGQKSSERATQQMDAIEINCAVERRGAARSRGGGVLIEEERAAPPPRVALCPPTAAPLHGLR